MANSHRANDEHENKKQRRRRRHKYTVRCIYVVHIDGVECARAQCECSIYSALAIKVQNIQTQHRHTHIYRSSSNHRQSSSTFFPGHIVVVRWFLSWYATTSSANLKRLLHSDWAATHQREEKKTHRMIAITATPTTIAERRRRQPHQCQGMRSEQYTKKNAAHISTTRKQFGVREREREKNVENTLRRPNKLIQTQTAVGYGAPYRSSAMILLVNLMCLLWNRFSSILFSATLFVLISGSRAAHNI